MNWIKKTTFHLGAVALLCIAVAGAKENTPPPASAQPDTFVPAEYRVRTGDVIRVDYRYTPEYNTTVEVQPDGIGIFPFLGAVKMSGLTVPQVQAAVLAKASERLKDPELTIALVGFEQPSYVVGGQVATPGKYQVHGRVTAIEAIAIAGGFRDTGKESQIVLLRPVDGRLAQATLIDLKNALKGKEFAENIEIKPGDVLIVPRTRLAKIAPFVHLVTPSTYGLYINPANF